MSSGGGAADPRQPPAPMSSAPEISTRRIVVPRSARVHLAGGPAPRVRELVVLLHGYGQLARDLLAECAGLASPERLLVAPEGLSRFYLRGSGGSTGASWMTREEREQEIADYVRYLDLLLAELDGELARAGREAVPVHALGFSQGTATACRWAALGTARLERLTLWAGGVPPDLDLEAARPRLGALELTLVLGTEDRWIDEARLAEERGRLERHGYEPATLRFEGGHRLDAATLARLFPPRSA